MDNEAQSYPLAVDLDGTLILTDMSWVSIRRVILPRPWRILGFLWLELTGRRAVWKQNLGKLLSFDPADLVYHASFMDWLTGEYARGRKLYLVTASDRLIAESIAAHVGIFNDVMASDGEVNLRGTKKAEALVARFGSRKFGYAGNSHVDLPVWESAGQVIVVNPERGLEDKVGDSQILSSPEVSYLVGSRRWLGRVLDRTAKILLRFRLFRGPARYLANSRFAWSIVSRIDRVRGVRAKSRLLSFDRSRLPSHISIIMDGNRRFAWSNSMNTVHGHSAGKEKLKQVMRWCWT